MATGNRTVRGLEAITLSVPPTPGQSIIRRKDNGGLYSIGSVFEDFGYTTRFVYGGYGYFDNMNAFYEGNDFKVTDRSDLAKSEIGFGNVGGVAGEDLFHKVIDLADADHAAGRPVLQLVMTTSNQRSYTYPEGRIDIPSRSRRLGGVKYADHAIGQLVVAARTQPWFDNTMFVFVADHTAGTSGRAELDPARYHIPFIVGAPDFIAPLRDERLASQIDVAPTILGPVGASFHSQFMGADLTQANGGPQRAFVGTYEKIGLQRGGDVAVPGPKAMRWAYHGADKVAAGSLEPALVAHTISAYQYAANWRHNLARVDARIARPAQP